MRPARMVVLAVGALFTLGAAPPTKPELKEDPHQEPRDRPFAVGVSSIDRERATEHYRNGNEAFDAGRYSEALREYRESLKIAPTPYADYNAAASLLTLNRPDEMREHLAAALANGLELVDKEQARLAKNYKLLLEQQLVHLRVTCNEPGATVTMNGRELLKPPGTYDNWLRPGQLSIVASKEGYVSNEVNRYFEGGQQPDLKLDLGTLEQRTRYTRRWAAWKPWAVIGGGALLAGGGGALFWAGERKLHRHDENVIACISGCYPGPEDAQGVRMKKGAVAAWSIAGAALVTGAVLAIVNRAQAHIEPYEVEAKPKVVILPAASETTRGLLIAGHF